MDMWDNWVKFMGEQINPGDSIDFTIPIMTGSNAPVSNSLPDYLGIPINGENFNDNTTVREIFTAGPFCGNGSPAVM